MYHFYYTDSCGKRHKFNFELNSYNSIMELIWDKGYEDWGDCRGRSWCGTCHVKMQHNSVKEFEILDIDERQCLSQLYHRGEGSRLSCQVLLDKNIHKVEFAFIGDE